MRYHWILFVFGILIFFLPFLGIPSSWKTVFLFVAGVYIALFALLHILKKRREQQSYITRNPQAPHGGIQ